MNFFDSKMLARKVCLPLDKVWDMLQLNLTAKLTRILKAAEIYVISSGKVNLLFRMYKQLRKLVIYRICNFW